MNMKKAVLLIVCLTAAFFKLSTAGVGEGASNEGASAQSVAGTWLSNWGPVTLVVKPAGNGVQISGFLQQDPGNKGTIENGSFDPKTRQLVFSYRQPWNNEKGTTTVTLSEDGKTMAGNWKQSKASGPYTMQLLFRGDPPKAGTAGPHGLKLSNKHVISVLPVIFIPSDCNWITQYDIDLYSYLVYAHLELCQKHYKSLLLTDTFKISDDPILIYRAKHKDDYYLEAIRAEHKGPGAAQLIAKELLDASHETRYNCKHVFLTVYVRSSARPTGTMHGGGRTFNGAPNTGGGCVEMELASLLRGDYYNFQSALNHEIGHAFGLLHPDAYGYDLHKNESNMSYNDNITSKGLNPVTGGRFNPEEFLALSVNKQIFPDFQFVPSGHNPTGKNLKLKYFDCMTDYIGQRRNMPPNSCMEYPCPCK
jgi:hypothetical protein